MASKPALKLEPSFRSGLEKNIADQLEAAGVPVNFEKIKIKYTVPASEHTYTPDFNEGTIIIEAKGAFGYGPRRFGGGDPTKERQKLILIKKQHPHLDLRIVFQRAATKIYKGSPTTYAKWATDNGFLWADKGTIPPEWIAEMKSQRNK
jgi:Phage endonuclease I.